MNLDKIESIEYVGFKFADHSHILWTFNYNDKK